VVFIEYLYKELKISIGGYDMEVNIMSLDLHDFNLILGIDCLSKNRAQRDCF
jgi:hypothetical protein